MTESRIRVASGISLLALIAIFAAYLFIHDTGRVEFTDSGDEISRNDLTNESAVRWSEYQIVDETHLRVTFSGGHQPCTGHRVEVTETTDSIIVDLFAGSPPSSPDQCLLHDMDGTILVELKDPIGDRKITQTH